MERYPKLSEVLCSNYLDVKKFENLISNNAQGYKFYWLEAIIRLIISGKNSFTFDEIINEMIWEAWQTVTYYHLRLGPKVNGKEENFLECAINILKRSIQDRGTNKNLSRDRILGLIDKRNYEIQNEKIHITDYVPYRLIKPFVDQKGKNYVDKSQYKKFITYINEFNKFNSDYFYNIGDSKTPLQKTVRLNSAWISFIKDNYAIIMGWLQYKKAQYIQDRNPGVPGIIYKVSPEADNVRRLNEARNLWKLIVQVTGKPLYDIYTEKELVIDKFDLDHFIPRSYIANDELWNLTPMNKKLNSSKNNKLPAWDPYFERFAKYQYYFYSVLFDANLPSHETLMTQYDKCKNYNVNSIWALEKLYVLGNTESAFKNILNEHMKAEYGAAQLQGYDVWTI